MEIVIQCTQVTEIMVMFGAPFLYFSSCKVDIVGI